jgi:hypothetical protein
VNTGTVVGGIGSLIAFGSGNQWQYTAVPGAAGLVLAWNGTTWVPSAPVVCQIFVGSAQSIPANTTTLVTFNSINIDTNGAFNASTYTFTAPFNGNYRISVYSTYSCAAGVTAQLQLQRNGGVQAEGPTATAMVETLSGQTFVCPTLNRILSCAAGDTVQLFARGSGAIAQVVDGGREALEIALIR